MATRKLFRFAAAAALLALITACGGGGGSGSTADPAPPVTAQSAVTLSLSISEQDRTVLVSTITTTDSKNAVAPVTEANAVTIDKVAYNVAGGLVKDSAGGNLLLPLDVKTAVSATVHTGGQVLSKTVELTATCATYTKNVGGVCDTTGIVATFSGAIAGKMAVEFRTANGTLIKRVELAGRYGGGFDDTYVGPGVRLYSGITGETAGEYSEVGLDGTVTVIDRLPHADQPWYTRTRSFDRNGTCAMATPLAGVDYSSYATIGSVGGCIAVMAITDPNASFRQFVYEYLVGIAPAKPVQVTYPNLQAVLYKP